jgi:hypothetical protein
MTQGMSILGIVGALFVAAAIGVLSVEMRDGLGETRRERNCWIGTSKRRILPKVGCKRPPRRKDHRQVVFLPRTAAILPI